MKSLPFFLSVAVTVLFGEDVRSAPPAIAVMSPQASSDANAMACRCPTRAQVNSVLPSINGSLISNTDVSKAFQANKQTFTNTSCTGFYNISDPSNLPLSVNGSQVPLCTFSAANSQNCTFSNCYNISARASTSALPTASVGSCPMVGEPDGEGPVMVYNNNTVTISCLDNAPSVSASVPSDIGYFLGKSTSNSNNCVYQNGVIEGY